MDEDFDEDTDVCSDADQNVTNAECYDTIGVVSKH